MNPRRVVEWVAILALVVFVGAFAIYAVPDVVGAEHSYVVLSGSMSPAIGPGDVVIVNDADPATISEGDVISFGRSGESVPTTHRVVDVQRQGGRLAFETKGDANENVDPELVPAGNVLGSVMFTIPYIGHAVKFAQTSLGFVVFLWLPLGLLAVTELWSFLSHYRRQNGSTGNSSGNEPGNGGGTDTEANANAVDSADSTGSGETEGGTKQTGQAQADGGPTHLSINPQDLTVTTAILTLVTPYAIYVAVLLQTALAVAVAFASVSILFAIGGLWSLQRLSGFGPAEHSSEQNEGDGETPGPEAATDGGAQPVGSDGAGDSDEDSDGDMDGGD